MSPAARTVHVITLTANPRIRHAFRLIECCAPHLEWILTDTAPPETGIPVVEYLPEPSGKHPCIPWSGFFSKPLPDPTFPNHKLTPDGIRLFPAAHDDVRNAIPFDLPASAFYLATGLSTWKTPHRDVHGRADEQQDPVIGMGIHETPTTHLGVRELLRALELPESDGRFSFEITVDVDHPWKHRHKPIQVAAGGLIRDIFQGRIREAGERISAVLTKRDPYDVFDFLSRILPRSQSRFFFLTQRHTHRDTRHTLATGAYRNLIATLSRDFPCGIHPSYTSSETPGRIESEKKRLEPLTGTLTASRQHYLRYRNPESFRELQAAGIADEYSLCPRSVTGFPWGLTVPFPGWDLERDSPLGLMFHPACVMDRTLQQYQKLSPESGAAVLHERIRQVKEVNGNFVVILHNESFSDSGEWKGWKNTFLSMIGELKQTINPDA